MQWYYNITYRVKKAIPIIGILEALLLDCGTNMSHLIQDVCDLLGTKRPKISEWVLIHFPAEKTGTERKLSQPWHGPYQVIEKNDPDITESKVYFPQHGNIQVHQSRVQWCPLSFSGGFYWYGGKRLGLGCPPKWADKLLTDGPSSNSDHDIIDNNSDAADDCSANLEENVDGDA